MLLVYFSSITTTAFVITEGRFPLSHHNLQPCGFTLTFVDDLCSFHCWLQLTIYRYNVVMNCELWLHKVCFVTVVSTVDFGCSDMISIMWNHTISLIYAFTLQQTNVNTRGWKASSPYVHALCSTHGKLQGENTGVCLMSETCDIKGRRMKGDQTTFDKCKQELSEPSIQGCHIV